MKHTPAELRAIALAELNAHSAFGVPVTDETSFDDLDMDSLDILAFAYGVEAEIRGFDGETIEWTPRTTIGKAIADIAHQHEKAHRHG